MISVRRLMHRLGILEIPDARVITIPIVDGITDHLRDSRKLTGSRTMRLMEGKIFALTKGPAIVLGIGGPPNSGKSTFAASLAEEMSVILDSLSSRGGFWEDLHCQVRVESLDVATPVADTILAGQGKDRQLLAARKVSWTKDLAKKTVLHIDSAALKGPGIIIADFPGKIDDLTGMLSDAVDVACVIARSQDGIQEWRSFFDDQSIRIVGEFQSSKASSLVTRVDRGASLIRGRINVPDRVAMGWDPVVRTFAELLLFEILPATFAKR